MTTEDASIRSRGSPEVSRLLNIDTGRLGVTRTFCSGSDRLSYEVHGSGPRLLVWLHALMLDANVNRDLAVGLAARGNRVILLDLLGHGGSDKPRHASAHRMDLYAEHVVQLLDELGIDQAVIGGISLGANVSLQAAVRAPDRVRGLVLALPVLEWAVPAAALTFVPLLLSVHYARPVVRVLSRSVARLPRTGVGPVDSLLDTFSLDPDEVAAVLHGLLVGPIAPTVEQRRAIRAPALVLGQRAGLIHPPSDAENLAHQLPNGRLGRTQAAVELLFRPGRLTAEVADFLDQTWSGREEAAM
jgi:pimeloyl-ACP methyl ester carboxylesterase